MGILRLRKLICWKKSHLIWSWELLWNTFYAWLDGFQCRELKTVLSKTTFLLISKHGEFDNEQNRHTLDLPSVHSKMHACIFLLLWSKASEIHWYSGIMLSVLYLKSLIQYILHHKIQYVFSPARALGGNILLHSTRGVGGLIGPNYAPCDLSE